MLLFLVRQPPASSASGWGGGVKGEGITGGSFIAGERHANTLKGSSVSQFLYNGAKRPGKPGVGQPLSCS